MIGWPARRSSVGLIGAAEAEVASMRRTKATFIVSLLWLETHCNTLFAFARSYFNIPFETSTRDDIDNREASALSGPTSAVQAPR